MFQIKLKNGGFDKSLQKIEDERNKLLGNRPDIRPTMIKVLDYFKQFGIFKKSLQKFDIFKNLISRVDFIFEPQYKFLEI